MFKIIGCDGEIHEAYGAFPDEDSDIQFILCNQDGKFYATNATRDYYRLYKESKNDEW